MGCNSFKGKSVFALTRPTDPHSNHHSKTNIHSNRYMSTYVKINGFSTVYEIHVLYVSVHVCCVCADSPCMFVFICVHAEAMYFPRKWALHHKWWVGGTIEFPPQIVSYNTKCEFRQSKGGNPWKGVVARDRKEVTVWMIIIHLIRCRFDSRGACPADSPVKLRSFGL